ncbi:nuclear transport factor 2 family protein [Phenylobacterium sp. SCN 70-31]|uniref:nuclear transport factor 2 family protein n=1 Tax=Phenylobacterium sp. SCN 70-31 TaxID=1660129 RepID=UPI00086C4E2F|nr:nuclear transport factor 2 family protein [Phenylobacterium sp. SCN 70-31]ODT85858.1 MAG: hypothetical protein ABS78_18755 [Phenylobacterium sp. SCN 70-31]
MIDDVVARLGEFEDRRKIADLILDYCRGVDRCDDALLRATYWPDAVDDHGAGDRPAMAFCDRVLPILREHCISTMHLVANSRVTLQGNRAFAETYVVARHYLGSARSLEVFVGAAAAETILGAFPKPARDAPFEYHAGGRYLDRVERREGEWRFAHRRLVFDWTEAHPASPALLVDIGRTFGRRDPSDAAYALFASSGPEDAR